MSLFPYSKIRPEQDELINSIEESVKNKKSTIIHAPTGLGKTVASLVPALEHAIKNNLTVFFLTSRHAQHNIAVETLKQIKEKHNLSFVITDLVGKRHMCLQDGVFNLRSGEFHEYCKKLREENRCEFYNNTKNNNKNTPKADVLISQIKKVSAMHTEEINDFCREDKFCPYEIATSLAKDSTVIIADYSYIFNDDIRMNLFRRTQKSLGDCIVIIDEAHNLPKRLIDSATERLSTFVLKRAILECNKNESTEMAVKLTSLMNALNDIGEEIKNNNKHEVLITKEQFMNIVSEIQDYEEMIVELNSIGEAVIDKQKQSFAFSVSGFLERWKGEDRGFARIFSIKDNKLNVMYKCLDPALISGDIVKASYCSIAMSGTLTPTSMYRDLLGFEDCDEKIFKSPFPDENKLSLIVPKTTTKFTERSDEQFKQIGNAVSEITNAVPGNCAVFFPSYSIRDQVFKHCSKIDKTTFLETQEMTKEEKSQLLEKFKSYSQTGAVLLGTSSGNFSEGIDLIGDFLKCVVVVGLPLQQPDLETQEAIKHYDDKFGKGWDYGYVFPAFNKVLQGAGRCIRSETDRGVVVYLDERYAWPQYIRCFPEDMDLKIKKDYIEEIKEFFA